jgi:hypothetical protein
MRRNDFCDGTVHRHRPVLLCICGIFCIGLRNNFHRLCFTESRDIEDHTWIGDIGASAPGFLDKHLNALGLSDLYDGLDNIDIVALRQAICHDDDLAQRIGLKKLNGLEVLVWPVDRVVGANVEIRIDVAGKMRVQVNFDSEDQADCRGKDDCFVVVANNLRELGEINPSMPE